MFKDLLKVPIVWTSLNVTPRNSNVSDFKISKTTMRIETVNIVKKFGVRELSVP